MSTLRAVAAVLLLAWAAQDSDAAAGGVRFPNSPVDPTMDDCREMAQQYFMLVRSTHEAIGSCLTGPARIGPGLECNRLDNTVREVAMRAWPHCSDLEAQACAIYARRDAEVSSCQVRALARARRENRDEAQRVQMLKQANDRFETLRDDYSDVKELITDPREFLVNKAAQSIWSLVFPDGRRASANDRPDLADEVYRTVFNFNDLAMEQSRNPVIRAIQETSMGAVRQVALDLNRTMMRIEADMREFTLNNAEMPRARPLPLPQLSGRAQTGGDAECALMADVDRSRRLLESQPERWLALNERCEGQ